ncbi:MAG: DUF2203 domain-containing protein [Chloroflexota bacterium]|nr:DUF2203 domain-containing protein [Chloroflexota bacterium]
MAARFFTVEQANNLLPRVIELVEEIRQARRVISAARPDMMPVLEKSIGNGGSRKAGELLPEFERIQAATQSLEELGVFLKDPDLGLVDFLHRRPDGREVFLCWQYGEDSVLFWHDIHAGFARRERLS